MHRAIRQLRNDHQIILGRLDDLERALNAEFCHPGASEAVRQVASFFDGEFLAHIAVEERALNSEVGEALGAKDEPIRQMLEEHQEIRRLASEFVAAARALDGSLDRFAVVASGCAAACNAAPARVALLRVAFARLPLWRRPV